jgi:L-amino acid N-acyltransferase YncA
LLLEDYLLGAGRVREMWGWIDIRNRASIAMVEALQYPCVGVREEHGEVHDGWANAAEIRVSLETWKRIRGKTPRVDGLIKW